LCVMFVKMKTPANQSIIGKSNFRLGGKWFPFIYLNNFQI